ncbi:acidic fibroblast growth factor intracellular binding protein, putative [Ixodes scapularis]|uniref:Acidic fibroblast growth factor intracellular binding protein, putative n=1 Tax=Ixodes scapularis TaxID=6945 RepID=B7P978_IXOSC|nr:acidic fibroblast growth factor intracellular binding protein, putative [Ixodes scapularis]|eukprot:XP_002403734.1 acidic fibroblast growth factor intracellular binding protein, putative [Ixodes scapularis]
MLAEVDVFVGNNTLIDPDVFQLWLEGYSAQDAAVTLHHNEVMKESDIPLELLKSDVLDHYRTLQMLERLLHSPVHLAEQWTFQLTPQTQRMLIAKYDGFFTPLILCYKCSISVRKYTIEINCRLNSPFDNIKRVYKVIEEMPGPLTKNIQTHFLLPEQLARKYAAVVYITHNRFETGKKKLNYLTLDNFIFCVDQMINNWSCRNPSNLRLHTTSLAYEESGMEMDREFLQQLREMKALLDREHLDRLKDAVTFSLWGRVSKHTLQDLESNFKSLTRTLVNIAYGLNHSKDLRDFFIDIVEKIIEPCRSAHWTREELQVVMEAFSKSPQSATFPHELHLYEVWVRYSETFAKCVCQMYSP